MTANMLNTSPIQLTSIFKYPMILFTAILITLLTFTLMEKLVHSDPEFPEEMVNHRVATVVMDPPEPIEIQPPIPSPPDVPLPPPMPPAIAQNFSQALTFDVPLPPPPPTTQIKHENSGSADSGAIPIVRIAPEYPQRQAQRGVEGYVDLAFDISITGQPINIRILESQPQGVFDRAASRALARWKYRPKVVDGAPTVQYGQSTRIRFDLQKG
ncbi:energy transducer TonB [Spongiibacter taiwanensis]|uniref:energy transducer TonB n=1 Tax=Spongiibacter taiwanensis TaxID=1748242 RepID=UPI00203563E4|nr:energy transducer TonB [Spongiibacter taiwanensis]USA42316.1 energy transducer TonB [Spongiibacter taiwanensis]